MHHALDRIYFRVIYCQGNLAVQGCSSENHEGVRKMRLLCEAVGTATHQHGLEECNVYGDPTVCRYKHSNSSAWVRSMYCIWRPYSVQI